MKPTRPVMHSELSVIFLLLFVVLSVECEVEPLPETGPSCKMENFQAQQDMDWSRVRVSFIYIGCSFSVSMDILLDID